MKFTKDQWALHTIAGVPAISLAIVCIGWYVVASIAEGKWLGGGSLPGLACGIAAGAIIAFEMLLWPRKFLRRLRLFPARYWMAMHLWFGFICLPIAIFHSGFHFGGTFANIFLLTLVLTYFSGIYGLVVQNLLPRWMLRNLPAETIYSQISHVSEVSVEDMRLLVLSAVGANPFAVQRMNSEMDSSSVALMPSTKQKGAIQGRVVSVASVKNIPDDADVLWKAYDEVEAFLRQGKSAGGPLADPLAAERWFDTLARSCDPRNENVVNSMRELFYQRRQFDIQKSVHHWLHMWLPVHIGLSVLVTILLVAHVILALRYW